MKRRRFLEGCTGSMAVAALAPAGKAASAAKLPQRPLGRTGVSVSILGLGGAEYLQRAEDDDAVAALLNEAIDAGINYFDTAANYQRSERNLGLVMGTPRRKEVFLATKVEERTHDGALRQVEASLKALRTDHLDLLQIHYVSDADDVPGFDRKDGVLAALRRLRDEKVVRFLGMSGHPGFPQVKDALERYDFDTFLCFVNPLPDSRPALTDQIPIAQRKKMGIVAMKAFGGGTPAILVGEGKGKAPAAALLRYALSQPISVAIPAVGSREQLRENLAAARAFTPMSRAEQQALAARFLP